MAEINRKVAGLLLQSKAIILEPAKPFTWASGWQSPIYCDNRVTLSYPEIRNYIKEAFTQVIGESFPAPEVVAGVATGAIAQGVLVAEAMNLPFVYVRPSAKEHGRQNLIEGRLQPGQRVVVVEDLISTGGSSLKAVEALRQAGAQHTLLSDSGLELLRQASQGLPRQAGRILKTSMQLAVPKGLNHLPDELIQQAIEELI